MLALHPEFIVDDKSKKKSVIVPLIEWEKILEILEDYEDIKAYDKAKNDNDEILDFKSAIENSPLKDAL